MRIFITHILPKDQILKYKLSIAACNFSYNLIEGGVQLLFGIKGKRWEVEYRQPNAWGHKTPFRLDVNYYDLFNEHWTYPSGDEVPGKAKSVEGACYW